MGTAALEAIEAEAAFLEQQSAPQIPPGAPGSIEHLKQSTAETAELIEMVWSMVGPIIPPRYADRYGPQQRARVASSLTVVAIKRGWDIGGALERYAPELALVVALVGPIVPVVLDDIKAARAAKELAHGGHQQAQD